MGEFPLFINGDALGWEQFMPVDGLTNASGAQAAEAILLDIGSEDMDDMVTIDDRDEKIKDVSFVLLLPFWPSLFCIPVSKFLIVICLPVLIGFFQPSHMCFVFCQVFPSLAEYFQLFLIITPNFLILSCNSCQSLHNEEKFLMSGRSMSFKSGTH